MKTTLQKINDSDKVLRTNLGKFDAVFVLGRLPNGQHQYELTGDEIALSEIKQEIDLITRG